MNYPRNPVAAVTHCDPYPYYAELVATKPLYYDEELGLWVASSAEMVSAVLQHPLCCVRPANEPVPKTLLGSAAATIFRHLVRMNDGAGHCPFKQAVSATLASIDLLYTRDVSQRWAHILGEEYLSTNMANHLTDFAFDLPVYVMANLLGFPDNNMRQIAIWMSDFVRCLAPTSSVEQLERGKGAAGYLYALFEELLSTQQGAGKGLLFALAHEARRVGRSDTTVIVANGIGFLSQAYEATAGLIGNTLLTLAAQPATQSLVAGKPDLLGDVIQEVLRYDPPIQNTRRFLFEDRHVAGRDMRAGDAVLVVLAAANRDPLAHSDPARFDLWRKDRRSFTFGVGAHACPGEALAPIIAQAAVEYLLMSDILSADLTTGITYRPSANARVPLFVK